MIVKFKESSTYLMPFIYYLSGIIVHIDLKGASFHCSLTNQKFISFHFQLVCLLKENAAIICNDIGYIFYNLHDRKTVALDLSQIMFSTYMVHI